MCGGMAWHIIPEFFYGVEGGRMWGFEEVEVEVEVETIISLFFFFIFGVLGQHMVGM